KEEGMIAVQELVPNAAPAGGQRVAVAPVAKMAAPPPPPADGPVLLLAPGDPGTALARQLLTRYAPKGGPRAGARKLTRDDLGLDAATFAALDADGDGALDAEELAQFGRRKPDLEVTAQLGRGPGPETLELTGPAGPLADPVRKTAPGAPLAP